MCHTGEDSPPAAMDMEHINRRLLLSLYHNTAVSPFTHRHSTWSYMTYLVNAARVVMAHRGLCSAAASDSSSPVCEEKAHRRKQIHHFFVFFLLIGQQFRRVRLNFSSLGRVGAALRACWLTINLSTHRTSFAGYTNLLLELAKAIHLSPPLLIGQTLNNEYL